MEKEKIDIQEATRLLEKLQRKCRRNGSAKCTVCGEKMLVEALDENAFRFFHIANDPPDQSPAWKRLSAIGAHLDIGHNLHTAETTWDSTLHYLACTGDLHVTL